MTTKEVSARVQAIGEMTGDPERAHEEEDKLYKDVLNYLSVYAEHDLAMIAAEALKTQRIDFPRWCA